MSTDSPTRLVYTPLEAAAALGISRAHLYNLLTRGDIPSVRIGHSRRIRVEDLHTYLDQLQGNP